MIACKDEQKKPFLLNGTYLGVVKDSTGRRISEILVLTSKAVKYDSVAGKDKIISDTAYGVLKVVPVLDSLKKQLKTISGKDSVNAGWLAIPKDSVKIISFTPISELLKQ